MKRKDEVAAEIARIRASDPQDADRLERDEKELQAKCKPCPWCGKRDDLTIYDGPAGKSVWCLECEVVGPQAMDEDQQSPWDDSGAVAKWNNRAVVTP